MPATAATQDSTAQVTPTAHRPVSGHRCASIRSRWTKPKNSGPRAGPYSCLSHSAGRSCVVYASSLVPSRDGSKNGATTHADTVASGERHPHSSRKEACREYVGVRNVSSPPYCSTGTGWYQGTSLRVPYRRTRRFACSPCPAKFSMWHRREQYSPIIADAASVVTL